MTDIEKLNKARSEVNTNPTQAQKEAGNYKMGHIKLLGFDITIENPKGSIRRGKDRNGKEWKVKMKYDYGYFTKTLGYDGDAVDVFIGNNLKSTKIFAIDQFLGGKFDETKFMIGFNNKEEAKQGYFSNYDKNWKGFKEITEININDFKQWLYNGKQQRKPFYEYKTLKKYFITEAQRKFIEKQLINEGASYKLNHYNDIYNFNAFNYQKETLKENQQLELTAYHGTCHDFNEFERGHEGTGEGSKLYGTGIYVSTLYQVGKHYAGYACNRNKKNGQQIVYKVEIPEDNGQNYLDFERGDTGAILNKLFINDYENALVKFYLEQFKENPTVFDEKFFALATPEQRAKRFANDEVYKMNKGGNIIDKYFHYCYHLGDDFVQQKLMEHGFIGIKAFTGSYTNYRIGEGFNYIIWDPSNIRIIDKEYVNDDNTLKESSRKKSYINMNVELRKGGRNAVKMSIEDFKKEMQHVYHLYCIEQNVDVSYKWEQRCTPGHFVYSCCNDNRQHEKSKYVSKLHNDIWRGKYKFDNENRDCRGGIKMSSKGFPYLQCYAGGDWECPVCFFVYFDGTHFRGYVPLKGNAINRDTNQAFGNDYYEEDSSEVKFLKKEFGVKTKGELPIDADDVDFNTDACLEDFLSRVEVKGTYKSRDYTKDEEKYEEYRDKKIEEKKQRDAEQESKQQEENKEYNDYSLNEGRKKVRKNDKGEIVPDVCPECGSKVGLYIHGEPVYLCSNKKCNKYFGTMPCNLKESKQRKIFLSEEQIKNLKESFFQNNIISLEDSIKNIHNTYNDPDSVGLFGKYYSYRDRMGASVTIPFFKCDMPLYGDTFLVGEPFTNHNLIRNKLIQSYLDNEESGVIKRLFKSKSYTIPELTNDIRDYIIKHENNGRFFIIKSPIDDTNICVFAFWSVENNEEQPNNNNIRDYINQVIEKCPSINECSVILIANGTQPYIVFKQDEDMEISITDNTSQKILHNMPAEEKWKQTQAFRDEKERLLGDKLAKRDAEGNKTGEEMPLAQYNALRYIAEETDFQRHQKYNFNDWLNKIKEKYDSRHYRVFEYNGFQCITYSAEGRGFGVKIFKNNILVCERGKVYRPDIILYVKRFIDQELIAKRGL